MDYIVLTQTEQIAYLALNRPEVFNSFNRAMALQLQEHLDHLEHQAEVRCIVITGNGKAFSAGQDLQEALDPNGPGLEKILNEHYNPIIRRLRSLSKPVIAAINGVAAGAGANIALACDIVVASDQASFIQAFSKIGLVPDSGGSFFLPRLVGWQRAAGLMMTGEKVGAADALSMGMVYKVFASEVFETEVKNLALQLANMPTKALAFTRDLLNSSFTNNFDQQLEEELKYQLISGKTLDYQEGVQAFMEKRKPVFKGM